MLREIIEIDEELCIGCGNCVPNCHQGALQVIDGKCRLISDLFCEGLGACVGHCPTGAMTIEKREAVAYDELEVMERMSAGGPNVIRAHLEHLEQHKQDAYLAQAHAYLEEHGIAVPRAAALHAHQGGGHGGRHGGGGGGCPGSRARSIGLAVADAPSTPAANVNGQGASSELRQWPIQLHLVPPHAPYFQGADVLLAADCTAFAVGAFHQDFLRGKALAIACPKLDQGQEAYIAKLVSLIDDARINTLTVMIMEVPCCGGLIRIAQEACASAQRKVPVKQVVLSLEGKIIHEDWVVV
ncbi:MAG: 4Fe-4S ferredoxin [Spirochaetaceae bacterium]|nr:MAG: 4Fe-4S ferredoxin [Spirochaetaceae bacterium]